MILRDRIIRYMYRHGKPVSRAQLFQVFKKKETSVSAAMTTLDTKSMVQMVGVYPCAITGKNVNHYALTSYAMDRIFNTNKSKKFGEFRVYTNQFGYEHLVAEPLRTYHSEEFGRDIKVYPPGYAVGYRPNKGALA